MAETLLSFGVEKLWDLCVRESDRLKGVGEQFNELKGSLNLLRSFLKDADAKKHTNATVKNFVKDIKEIVLDTEDIVETFLLKEELRETSSFKKPMRKLSYIVVDRRKIALDIESINKRIFKVIDDMQKFGVQKIVLEGGEHSHPLQVKQRERRRTFSSNSENNLVGLDDNVKKLVGYLVEEDSSQVVSIIGMGGIGKTTLARQVFNHEMVKNHFDGIVWVCVSQEFTRKYVWEAIFKKLSSEHNYQREHDEQRVLNMSEDEIQAKLFRLLETSNSLIVLDDMWNEEDWDIIKPVFPSQKGWKVLLTSRKERVALRIDPRCVIVRPECLTSEESWTLFKRIAFPFPKDTSRDKANAEMEKLGKQMIKHCGGLPLAIKVLGGLLATQHTLNEWKMVCENIGSHIVGGTSLDERNINSVYHILYLSFEELPIYLKQCFLYLAHFPEDFRCSVDNLAYYWAAEGIPKPENYENASFRDVADVCIEELVMRNMVISERDIPTSRFEKCNMHDMMRDICLRKAKEENFVHIVHGTSITNSECRRLLIHLPSETFNMEVKMMNPKLRSILLRSKEYNSVIWKTSDLLFTRLQLIRVLDLCFAKFKGGKVPSSIGKLIHLRYLSLFMAEVSQLPYSMRNLKKLLYLNLLVDVRVPIYLPNFFKEMRELACLVLPSKLHDKVKMELGNLVNMEVLSNFATKNCNVKDLHQMIKLQSLKINYNGGCTMETLSSSLGGLDWVHIEFMDLTAVMLKLPDEQHFPSSLTSIRLTGCQLTDDPMQILEKLPQLKKLSFWQDSFYGRRMFCSSNGFPKLHYLDIELKEWEEWIIEEGSMPLLYTFIIDECPKLRKLPDGMRFTTSLKELVIYTGPSSKPAEWKDRFSEGGEDYYKVQHILDVKVYE